MSRSRDFSISARSRKLKSRLGLEKSLDYITDGRGPQMACTWWTLINDEIMLNLTWAQYVSYSTANCRLTAKLTTNFRIFAVCWSFVCAFIGRLRYLISVELFYTRKHQYIFLWETWRQSLKSNSPIHPRVYCHCWWLALMFDEHGTTRTVNVVFASRWFVRD